MSDAPVAMPAPPVRFDTKIALVLRAGLLPWQELNAAAFLVSGVAVSEPEVVGAAYADADGTPYLSMFRQPVLVFQGEGEQLESVRSRASERGIAVAVYPRVLFSTFNDEDNRAAVRELAAADLDLVGVAVRGPKIFVDRILKGIARHP